MIQATNTEHLEPLEATKPSVTTGWSRATAYGGADYITDGHSLVVTSAIPAAASQRLLAKLTVPWPTRLTRPNQEAIATFVTRVVSNATLTATLLGVAGGQAFLQVGERAAPPQFRQQVLIPAARLAYLVQLTGADNLKTGVRAAPIVLYRGGTFVGLIARDAR